MLPGRYAFYASAPGVIPALGHKEFQVGYRYTWTFYITTTVTGGMTLRRRRR